MTQIRSFVHRIIIRAMRFRHRNGYGVHSPFAFNFIKGVVYEHSRYYAYRELAQQRRRQRGAQNVSARLDKLMFRIANYARPQNAAVVGAKTGMTSHYIAAGCRIARVKHYADALAMPRGGMDMCYVAPGEDYLEAYRCFAPGAGERSVFVAAHIYAAPHGKEHWKAICADSRAVVTFDLYEAGLVFFDTGLNKQDYVVSF